jgi:hypothetical protein
MKRIILAILFGITVASTASQASSLAKTAGGELAAGLLDGHLSVNDVARAGVHAATSAGAVPTAVTTASTLGIEATTGTAIASLNGAAAVSATSYAVGAPVVSALGLAAAPAVVGGVIIGGVAVLVAVGINELFFSED